MNNRETLEARAPDLVGRGGKAWKLDHRAMLPLLGRQGQLTASVAWWIVSAPAAHPVWHGYELSLIHLRDLPGLPTPVLYRPGATHELVVHALNPDHPLSGVIATGKIYRLTPKNFAAQLVETSDDAAAARVEDAARKIVAGELSPDSDHVDGWIRLFGENMLLPLVAHSGSA